MPRPRVLSAWLLYLLVIFCTNTPLLGQHHPISIADRLDAAEVIALVELRSQDGFWDASHHNIFTLNRLRVVAYAKGGLSDSEIGLVSRGGLVGDTGQRTWPSVQLDRHHRYWVIMERAPAGCQHPDYPGLYQAKSVAGRQGVLIEQDGRFFDLLFPKNPYDASELLRLFRRRTGVAARLPDGTPYFPEKTSPLPANRTSLLNSATVGGGLPVAGTIEGDHALRLRGSNLLPFPLIPFGTANFYLFNHVEFSDASTGGATYLAAPHPETDIISWDNDSIVVRIPPNAGTGFVRVRPFNAVGIDSLPIAINWAIEPVYSTTAGFAAPTRQRLEWVNTNFQGGYTFQANPAMQGIGDAMRAMYRAISDWRCGAFVNLDLTQIPDPTPMSANGNSQIHFTNTLPMGTLASATMRYTNSYQPGICTGYNTLWRITDMDIEFASNLPAGVDWAYGTLPTPPGDYDFEGMALKMIGRAMGLGYINDSALAMYYHLPAGKNLRTLTSRELSAAVHKITHSMQPNCVINPGPMQIVTGAACVLESDNSSVREEWNPEVSVEANSRAVNLRWSQQLPFRLAVYDMSGREIYQESGSAEEVYFSDYGLAEGLYTYRLILANDRLFSGKWLVR